MNHDLSGDERMARFDAQIFSDSRLFWPIPPFWRPFMAALKNSMFIQPIGDHEAWVSGYLPINASLIAAIGKVTDPSLASPLLVGVGFFALWNVAQQLWPDSPSARAATLLLYAGSSQVIVTGMTKFAMSAHLALNLVWLALFLKDRREAHFGATIVGFLATGLHQPLFHPLFVLPFMGVLAARRRWRLLAFYAASYAVISAFWLAWPIWISSHGVEAVAPDTQSNLSFFTRLILVLNAPNANALLLMPLESPALRHLATSLPSTPARDRPDRRLARRPNRPRPGDRIFLADPRNVRSSAVARKRLGIPLPAWRRWERVPLGWIRLARVGSRGPLIPQGVFPNQRRHFPGCYPGTPRHGAAPCRALRASLKNYGCE